jgi:hypothetical protein
MADSTEQKIVTRALAVLAAINGTGSYQTTLGSTIVAGTSGQSLADSRPNWDQDELPAISVFQGPVDVEDRDDENQKVLRHLPLIIRGTLERGTDASTARKLISDIMRAMRAAGDKWTVSGTNLALYTNEGPHMIEYAEGTYEITGVEQQIDIYYSGSNMDLDA